MYLSLVSCLTAAIPALAYNVDSSRSVQPDSTMSDGPDGWPTGSSQPWASERMRASGTGHPSWPCTGPMTMLTITKTVNIAPTSTKPSLTVFSSSTSSVLTFATPPSSQSSVTPLPVGLSTSASSFGLPVTTTTFIPALSANATKTTQSSRLTALPPPLATGNATKCLNSSHQPQNASACFPSYLGLNVVNEAPFDPQAPETATGWKTAADWNLAFDLIKAAFPKANAVRIYSTTETGGGVNHLNNSVIAALNTNMKLLAGVWSQPPARFDEEFAALKWVVETTGCDNFAAAVAAVSVGNEDLYVASSSGDNDAMTTANSIVDQIAQVRDYLRSREGACCSIPVTHTDTFNMYTNTSKPWVTPLLSAVDQAIIANIFPYWSNATARNAFEMITNQSYAALHVAQSHNKDLWLGETGWPTQQFNNENVHGTNTNDAQQYFNTVGCQILTAANGTAFYYADWDQDQAASKKPTFGLFDFQGKPILNVNCTNYAPELYFAQHPEGMPSWLGGTGARKVA